MENTDQKIDRDLEDQPDEIRVCYVCHKKMLVGNMVKHPSRRIYYCCEAHKDINIEWSG